MNAERIQGYLKTQIARTVEHIRQNLPDETTYDWRLHLLPRIFPFLAWKNELNNRKTLQADLLAGLLGAIIVLPQGIAFAMIAGLPPIYGLYTAMITPVIAALFGSSRHLISGPTTPISIVIFGAVSKFAAEGTPSYLEMVLLLTFLAGAIQLALGLGRLGKYVSFVSHTVVVGFTAGAAMLIMTNALKGILGLAIPARASFLETWRQIFGHFFQLNESMLAVGGVTIISALFAKRIAPKWPHLLIALFIGSFFAWAIGGASAGVPFVAEIPRSLPSFSWPGFSPDNFRNLMPQAFAVALLGLIEAVAIGRSIAIKSGQALDTNQEFIGQGLSNVVGSFFSCYAGSGSFTRSGVNFQSGARTPMAAVFAAGTLALIVLMFAPMTRFLPMPALNALILLVGWNLIDVPHIREIHRASRQDNIILGTTFFSALFLELEFAIYIGVLLSLFFFLKRTAQPNVAVMAPDKRSLKHSFVNTLRVEVPQCPQVKIVRLDGALYFGAIDHISNHFREFRRGPEKWVVLLASGVNFVDYDGCEWLAAEAAYWKNKKKGGLVVVRLKIIAQEVMESGGYFAEIGQEHFFLSKEDALRWVYARLDRKICGECRARIFWECEKDPSLPPVLEGLPVLRESGRASITSER